MTEFSVAIGPQFEGESVRKVDLYAELGGPKVKRFELLTIKGSDEVEDGKVEIVGPNLSEMEPKQTYPFAILIAVAGSELEKDMEPVLERRIHMYSNYIEGLWHMGSRDDIWVRIHKDSYEAGFRSLKEYGDILIHLFTSEVSAIKKISVTFVTDGNKVEELLPHAYAVYKLRDERIRGLREEDVEEFYGCIMCQSFAPQHICVITPERPSLCGSISWFDGKAAFKMDPEGPQFQIRKGEILNPRAGEYSGVNEAVAERSMGANKEFYLHSAFGKPHTSCGCFQSILFYIPEVDGFGVVHREFTGETPTGMTFSTMAGEVSGGRQVEGYVGMAVDYLRSPKFMMGDGGHKRLVWLPKEIKERVKNNLPKDLYDKIATEEDAGNVEELQEYLNRVGHPWVIG